MASSPITSWQIERENIKVVTDSILLASKITVDGICSHEIKKVLAPWKGSYDRPRQSIKKTEISLYQQSLHSQSNSFSSSHVWMWELDQKGLWCWRRPFESSLGWKKIKPVNPKGNKPWIFIGRTDDEAEALTLWPPDVKCQLIEKDPKDGKDWRQKEKGEAEDEMVG